MLAANVLSRASSPLRTLVLALVMAIAAMFGAHAPAQTCGVWLDGPTAPGLPLGSAATEFAVAGTTLFAPVTPQGPGGVQVWKLNAGTWTDLGWDSTAFGLANAITVNSSQVAVASSRIIGQSGDFNIWEIAVRVHDGSAWQVVAMGTRQYVRETQMSRQVNVHLRSVVNHADTWYIAGQLSVSNIVGYTSQGVLYRFTASGIETFATGESRGCFGCLNPGEFNAVISYNGMLYVAGGFSTIFPAAGGMVSASNIAALNGMQWQAVSGGVNASVKGMYIQPSIFGFPPLIVWGSFSQAGSTPANRIASYQSFNGQWSALGTGLTTVPVGATAIAGTGGAFDIDLLVAGVLNAGGVPVDGFARWTGSVWEEFGDPGLGPFVAAVATLSGTVIAGGQALSSNGQQFSGAARWNGTQWATIGMNGTNEAVHALHSSGGSLYAGGVFTTMDDVPAMHVARRGASGWEALGAGTDGPVEAIATYGGEVVVAGSFSMAGGAPAANVAAWNGSAWRALGNGLNDAVRGLAVWNGNLVAVGDFGASGGTPMTGVAKWNGTAWAPVDPAFNLTDLQAVTVHNNELYIGGDEPVDVRRFNGTSFQVVGGGVNGNVYAITSLAGSLYVGGDFTTVGSNLPYRRVARWTGSQWLSLAQGANDFTSGAVRSLVPATDQLFVGGEFQVVANSGFIFNLARWNGVSWLDLPSGSPDEAVRAGTLHEAHLWIGGDFMAVGQVVSAHVAEWSQTPVFLDQPEPVQICEKDGTGTAVFSVVVAAEPNVTLRWRRNGTPLNDGLRISGSTTNEVTIYAVTAADAGTYTCVATDGCGGMTTSDGAALSVGGCCSADFNHDGFVNTQDFFDFVTAFFNTVPSADVNHDGFINSQDFFDFITAFFAGC